jgi:NAD-dependent SIR2 family protein deacetylase
MKRRIAVFLGAGASKAFQYPLTSDILRLIVTRINSGKLFDGAGIPKITADQYRTMIRELLLALSPGLKPIFKEGFDFKTYELPLITELLSQAEHFFNYQQAILDYNHEIKHPSLGQLKSINERWELKDLITLLDWSIISVINEEGNVARVKLPKFINWVKKSNQSGKSFVSVITTNYDFAIEWNLLTQRERDYAHRIVDYGFNWRDVDDGEVYLRPTHPMYRIYKLHGSIDWLKCDRCGYIYVNPLVDIYDLAFSDKKKELNSCHCAYWPLKPVLVTPSYSRNTKDVNLSQIWRNTLEELRLADEWIIAGYSLPGEDLDIKSLFIRALAGRPNIPTIKVIQQSNRSKSRFDNFFGKNRYQFVCGGFENYNFNS